MQFVNALDEAVDVTFVDFDTDVRVGRFSPPSYQRLFERIRERKAKRCTALYDALGVYLETALEPGGPARAAALHRRRRQHEHA